MALVYPQVSIGRFKLGLGFNNDYMNKMWGFELGERFHKDPEYRVSTIMDIDRAVYEDFGCIGIGYAKPKPRPSVEPFGHRLMPAMLGCQCRFSNDGEPWALPNPLSEDQIRALPEWDSEGVSEAQPMKEIASQNQYLKKAYGSVRNLRDLGSAMNTALSMMGEDLLARYLESPEIVCQLFQNITRLTILCIECIEQIDGMNGKAPLALGNCSVTMISPADYLRCNLDMDSWFHQYCVRRGLRFVVHQDSGVTPHLDHYSHLGPIDSFDVGIDTDFEKLHRLCPKSEANCIIFPQWLLSTDESGVSTKLEELMLIGAHFPQFSFSMYEIDSALSRDQIIHFVEIFTKVVQKVG
jgi:hypothetical protein